MVWTADCPFNSYIWWLLWRKRLDSFSSVLLSTVKSTPIRDQGMKQWNCLEETNSNSDNKAKQLHAARSCHVGNMKGPLECGVQMEELLQWFLSFYLSFLLSVSDTDKTPLIVGTINDNKENLSLEIVVLTRSYTFYRLCKNGSVVVTVELGVLVP